MMHTGVQSATSGILAITKEKSRNKPGYFSGFYCVDYDY